MNGLEGWLRRGEKSPEHGDFLKKERLYSFRVGIAQFSLLFIFIALWEISSRSGWIDPLLFSSPSRIWGTFWDMLWRGDLHHHTLATVWETVVGFIAGTVAGTLIAIAIWWSKFLSRLLDPYLVVLNGMPKVALGPLFIVAFGGGFMAIVAMAVAISVIVTTIVVYGSFREVDQNYIKLVQTFGANKAQIFSKIILPASFPAIIATLKVNVGLAWVGVIVGEFLVSKQGLGYLIIYGFQVFNLTLVFVSLFIIAICATIMYHLVQFTEKILLRNRD
ncbi:ABC transporter permease [Ammoniphilus sp. CFH 90114]|uniref:ABC transporter permease n=1 Tax=Ammoniphilus sp. CFH 90114 TaxID=2493665 RepID=UPI00100DCF74|nr:ABC transporter permease [Ammoniphilus sp. CFH 90114]RXT14681.1 ABC transporter permease [Ammoniphilus sp. CFH 90114]